MKKTLYWIILMIVMVLPQNAFAREMTINGKKYEYMNYEETLEDSGIEKVFDNYVETSDQVTIYLFRGKNCEYCDAFLDFLNKNTAEYGKYFKLVSFEIYGDNKNIKLLNKVAEHIKATGDGIPFVVIGNHFFEGYSSDYDEKIKEAIVENYEIDIASRADIMESISTKSNSESALGNGKIVFWNLLIVIISTTIIILFFNKKINKLDDKISMIKPVVKK